MLHQFDGATHRDRVLRPTPPHGRSAMAPWVAETVVARMHLRRGAVCLPTAVLSGGLANGDGGQFFLASGQVTIVVEIADDKLRRLKQAGFKVRDPSCHAR